MEYAENVLSCEMYRNLRNSVGWLNFSENQAKKALENSLYTIAAVEDGRAVGMGRLIGDGLYYTIVDIVVSPDHQGKGIGGRIVDLLLKYIEEEMPVGGRSSVQLIAEKGKELFYVKKGFKLIPHEFCGPGMRMVIHK